MPARIKSVDDMVTSLKNKTIKNAEFDDDILTLTLDDGSVLTAGHQCGVGADSGWYNWTEIKLNGQIILDK